METKKISKQVHDKVEFWSWQKYKSGLGYKKKMSKSDYSLEHNEIHYHQMEKAYYHKKSAKKPKICHSPKVSVWQSESRHRDQS